MRWRWTRIHCSLAADPDVGQQVVTRAVLGPAEPSAWTACWSLRSRWATVRAGCTSPIVVRLRGQAAQARDEPAGPGCPQRHSPCRGSDRGRAFDEPHVELERHQGRGGARDREEVGARSMTPAAKAIIDVKIGLRTHRKGPVVTRSVRSSGSTPARHELPMTSWAQTARPAPAHASPRMTATSPRSESTGSRSPDAWRAAPTPTAAVPIRRARPLRTSKTPAPSAGRPARSSRIATCGTPAGTARRR